MKKKSIIISLLFNLISCGVIDSDDKVSYSFNDPLFLGINEVSVECSSSENLSGPEFKKSYQEILDQYRISSHKFDFLKLRQNDRSKLCNLSKFIANPSFNFDSLSHVKKESFLINTYNIMIINLIVTKYDEVNELGKPNSAESKSILNIGTKGLSVFNDYQWPIMGKYNSLNEVEEKLIAISGEKMRLALYRGTNGFSPLPEIIISEDNIQEHLNSIIYKIVNEDTFYDELSTPPTLFPPGSLELYFDKIKNYQLFIRNLIKDNLDIAVWGESLNSSDLLIKDQSTFLWKIEYEPIDWQLAEGN